MDVLQEEFWPTLLMVAEIIALMTVPSVINQRKPAVSTIAWIFALLFVPIIGPLSYFVLGHKHFRRRLRRRHRANDLITPKLEQIKEDVPSRHSLDREAREALVPLHRSVAGLTQALGAQPLMKNNAVELLVGGATKFPALMEEIERATDHIHILYYIIESDETGVQLRDLLIKKAREGVKVRVLWDVLGSYVAAIGFLRDLVKAGGVESGFMPARFSIRRLDLNFRNHRKIVVIDGAVGFVGGMNIGNEYSGLGGFGQPWHDMHLRLRGPVVHQLQEVFCEDWYFATRKDLTDKRYFPEPVVAGDLCVQIVSSGPDQKRPVLHEVFFVAFAEAQESIHIMTPYFVPSPELLMALTTAASRGVEVKIMTPSRSDQPLALWAGRSYFQELLEAGVQIFEYTRSMLHAKVLSVDGTLATVGTTNMDMRSFYLNFEVNALIYAPSFAEQLRDEIERDMTLAQPILLPEFEKRSWWVRSRENFCRLFSPML